MWGVDSARGGMGGWFDGGTQAKGRDENLRWRTGTLYWVTCEQSDAFCQLPVFGPWEWLFVCFCFVLLFVRFIFGSWDSHVCNYSRIKCMWTRKLSWTIMFSCLKLRCCLKGFDDWTFLSTDAEFWSHWLLWEKNFKIKISQTDKRSKSH